MFLARIRSKKYFIWTSYIAVYKQKWLTLIILLINSLIAYRFTDYFHRALFYLKKQRNENSSLSNNLSWNECLHARSAKELGFRARKRSRRNFRNVWGWSHENSAHDITIYTRPPFSPWTGWRGWTPLDFSSNSGFRVSRLANPVTSSRSILDGISLG